jgi:hypothetical protein
MAPDNSPAKYSTYLKRIIKASPQDTQPEKKEKKKYVLENVSHLE